MGAETGEAHRQAEQAAKDLEKQGRERTALRQAHYDGAIPTDLLKTEMDRLTRAMARAQRGVDSSKKHLDEVEGQVASYELTKPFKALWNTAMAAGSGRMVRSNRMGDRTAGPSRMTQDSLTSA